MKHLTVELIPDPEFGGFTARVPAIADLREALIAYVEEFGSEAAP